MMIPKESKKIIVLGILAIGLLTIPGCGNKYESQITEQVRTSCVIPDSFKKVSYKEDPKNGIAYLDFKAKNLMGVEIPQRLYIVLFDDGYRSIQTEGIDKSILEDFFKNDPKNFEGCVSSYKTLTKLINDLAFELRMVNELNEELNTVNKKDYYSWVFFREESRKLNLKIKKFKDAYKAAPEIVQKNSEFQKFNQLKYMAVIVTGDWMSWRANKEVVEEYPES